MTTKHPFRPQIPWPCSSLATPSWLTSACGSSGKFAFSTLPGARLTPLWAAWRLAQRESPDNCKIFGYKIAAWRIAIVTPGPNGRWSMVPGRVLSRLRAITSRLRFQVCGSIRRRNFSVHNTRPAAFMGLAARAHQWRLRGARLVLGSVAHPHSIAPGRPQPPARDRKLRDINCVTEFRAISHRPGRYRKRRISFYKIESGRTRLLTLRSHRPSRVVPGRALALLRDGCVSKRQARSDALPN